MIMSKMVRISDEVHKRLRKMGTLDDSYSSVIEGMLDYIDKHRKEYEKFNEKSQD